MRKDSERLVDVLEAIEKIERFAAHGKDKFLQDEVTQVWIFYHLQIIGEALFKLPREFRSDFPDVPWKRYISIRNILVHEYYERNLEVIWQTVIGDLPDLKDQIAPILKTISDEGT